MKILLLGEFSGLHRNLKEGLVELGHDATVAASGDGFKKIPVDISFDFNSSFNGAIGKAHKRLKLLSTLLDLKDYDVVQMVNPFIFPRILFPSKYSINKIIEGNDKFFLSAAGSDAYYWRYGRRNLAYGPFEDNLKYDLKLSVSPLELDKSFSFNQWLVEESNGVIPIMYEYEASYNNVRNRLNTIPIPINIEKIKYSDNVVKEKIVIFHGLSRYGFKGTRHIEEAFDYLRCKYPNDLELVIEGNLPLDEYLNLMSRTNVVIDQMYTYSLGVNGIYAMAMGKVVMGGAEPEGLDSLGLKSSPVINLKPNAESLIKQIELLLENKNQIIQIGFESRQFVEKVHGHVKVAQQYVDTWISN